MKREIQEIYKLIKKYDNIYIARHIGPDPDAVSSEIALKESIQLTFPDKKVYAVGNHVSRFKYLGMLDKVSEIPSDGLLIVVDNPTISRTDGLDPTKFKNIIVIDHHPTEDLINIAKCSMVDTNSSSAAQLVAKLIINSKLKMTKEIAEKLFAGIVSDSDRFLLGYTSADTFYVVGQLMDLYHIDILKIYNYVYERPLAEIKFKGYISSNLEVTPSGFASIVLENDLINEMNVDIFSASNMINDFNYIKEVLVWAFATHDEKANLYRINIRSRGPIINEIASKYNGGGHPQASGARIESLDDVKSLFNELDLVCQKYREENGN